ncbi:LytR/AlgR family response regulator transcription factor [Pseudofulvibacter geojedonensis]|uniref:LytR/AlgR family response regulator transcription factor n=1 Tax=Pseudofulvibacter geojedonensis TaxID=1123758 RepID=A0ABW3I039_9FLAO
MTCVIIEDEIPAQKVLLHYINKIPNLTVLKVFNSAMNANDFLKNHKIDILFLDINLPDISGIDYIKTIDNPPAVIMTTAYPDYAVASFELPTITDYLVKPFSFNRFLKSVNKVEKNNHKISTEKTIYINVDKTIHKIQLKDIKYIFSEKNYVTVVTTTTKFSYLESLKNLETKLPSNQFIRSHKSFIINSNYITKISGNQLFMKEVSMPIGRAYKAILMEKLNL